MFYPIVMRCLTDKPLLAMLAATIYVKKIFFAAREDHDAREQLCTMRLTPT